MVSKGMGSNSSHIRARMMNRDGLSALIRNQMALKDVVFEWPVIRNKENDP